MSGFRKFWVAETVSEFGTYVTTIALQVLVLLVLGGTAFDVGLLNASRWLPYVVLGLVVGALVDRWRRKPLLVSTDLGRAVLLGAIPLLWVLGVLSLPVLFLFVALFGILTLLNDSASQSFLPRLVPPGSLLGANARLDQSAAVAQTSGPLIAGGLISAIGAPLAVLVDAASYLLSAVLTATIRITEPPATREVRTPLRADIAEGLRFVYRHRMLGPMAISTHAWFLANSIANTAFVPFALLGLGLTPLELGITLAAAGIGGLAGSLLSARLGLRFGAGRVIIASRAAMPIAWGIIALGAIVGPPVLIIAIGQLIGGFAMGAESANEMAYRQSVTPDALQARMNTTMRSANRGIIVIGAPLGGLLADGIGYLPTLAIAAGLFAVVAVGLGLSPFRGARHGDPAAG